jgi:two-component system LytT family response regulator
MNSTEKLLRCVVVEDEETNRTWLCERLGEFPEVEVVGEAASVSQAFRTIVQTRPNGLFLDIKLIGGDAFQLLQQLKDNQAPIPPIVMVTAFDEYAVQTINDWGGYVKKYLEKPFLENWKEKLRDCINALIAANELSDLRPPTAAVAPADHIFVKDGAQLIRVNFADILWIEVAGGGAVYLVTEEQQAKWDITLSKLLTQLPPEFIRISRDVAVNQEKIHRVDREDRGVIVSYRGKEKFLGIGDAYYRDLLNALRIG